MEDSILIPKERIPILLGTRGRDKYSIEKQGKCKLNVDSESGEVVVRAVEAIDLWVAMKVVEAIARGFSPETARKLFKEDYGYDVVHIDDFAKNKKRMIELRGRVIGENGKAKQVIQTLTNAEIAVYGKTVAIIGNAEKLGVARRAVEMLLSGASHPAVFAFVEKQGGNYVRKTNSP